MDSDTRQDHVQAGDVPFPAGGTEFLGLTKGTGRRPRYLVRRADGRVVQLPWVLYRTLRHVDGRRTPAELAERLRDDVASEVVDGRGPDGRAVEAGALDDERVGQLVDDRLRPAGLVTARAGDDPAAYPAGPGRRPTRIRGALMVGTGLIAGAAVAAAVVLTSGTGDAGGTARAAAAPPSAGSTAGLTGPSTFQGRVLDVLGPRTVAVDVQGRRLTVEVIGLGATDSCAVDGATAFARDRLAGQTVTLVPDPTLPGPADDAPTWPAYLVSSDQQSYTDAALSAGWATAGEGRYRSGFLAEQEQAQDDRLGMWGPPCNVTTG